MTVEVSEAKFDKAFEGLLAAIPDDKVRECMRQHRDDSMRFLEAVGIKVTKSKNLSLSGALAKLPYRCGTKLARERLREAISKKEEPVKVNCFGIDKYEIVGKRVKIYNEEHQFWHYYDCLEYQDVCPMCGTLMQVRAIKGSTWLALCSKACGEKLEAIPKGEHDE